ncbi:MAG TPA: sulfite exporter TauE/SafE family protein [Alcaligenes sp.]|nr:sulfite exporter TauE/SafE family protein [Alcaligenes sp.]HRL27455.1 sulfite exporter TauE/SafE family protein [Alcaligenes sp.]
MLTDPLFYLAGVPAVLLLGISKGGFGGGLGGFSLPLLLLVMPPLQAAAIMLPLLCLADFTGLKAYFGKWDWSNLRIILPGAVIGTALGWWTFDVFESAHILLLIGVISVGYACLNIRRRAAGANRALSKNWLKGGFWSTLSGFTSFVSHAGGPPLQIYLLPQRLNKETYIATTNIFFLLINLMKLPPYYWLGQFSPANLWLCLALAPWVPIGVYLGVYLQRRVQTDVFYGLLQFFLLLTGLWLIYKGWQGLS